VEASQQVEPQIEETEHDEWEPGAGLEDEALLRLAHDTKALQQALADLGFPLTVDGELGTRTTDAVRDFQRGHAFWNLTVDGLAGPRTWEALEHSRRNGGRTSPHFTFREFKSRGDGWIKLSRTLVLGLESYRDLIGAPVTVISGYRDPAYNAKVGGAPNSQHKFGNACDLNPVVGWEKVRALRRFSGIGIMRQSGLVRHVDVRHTGPNTTGGQPDRPTIWYYG
jgi:Peptidase M15/Putative peptidoglycan binding domain